MGLARLGRARAIPGVCVICIYTSTQKGFFTLPYMFPIIRTHAPRTHQNAVRASNETICTLWCLRRSYVVLSRCVS